MGPQPLRPHLPSQSHCLLSQICKLACKLCEDSIELLCCCVSPPFPMVWELLLIKQATAGFNAGKFASLPAMLPCMTLTHLSFHRLESPTSSTTGRETIVHGVILSVCWWPPAAFAPCCSCAFILIKTKGHHLLFPS